MNILKAHIVTTLEQNISALTLKLQTLAIDSQKKVRKLFNSQILLINYQIKLLINNRNKKD